MVWSLEGCRGAFGRAGDQSVTFLRRSSDPRLCTSCCRPIDLLHSSCFQGDRHEQELPIARSHLLRSDCGFPKPASTLGAEVHQGLAPT